MSTPDRNERRAVESLVRELIDNPARPFTAADRAAIVRRMQTAPFSADSRTLKEWARLTLPKYLGKPHPTTGPSAPLADTTALDSLEWHTLKHTVDGCWTSGTTPVQYLQDLRDAVSAADKIDVGRESKTYPRSQATRTADQSATRTPTMRSDGSQAFSRIIAAVDRTILVIYDAGRGCICTSYALRASDAETTLTRWQSRRTHR